MNVGMDYYWFGKDAANQTEMISRLLNFSSKIILRTNILMWMVQHLLVIIQQV